jgi:hypothetical protein
VATAFGKRFEGMGTAQGEFKKGSRRREEADFDKSKTPNIKLSGRGKRRAGHF